MANVGFTRDEIILTLDVLFSSGDDKLTKNSSKVAELCETLQLLPIHPAEKRPPNFRNTVGVSDQIRAFRQEMDGVERSRWGSASSSMRLLWSSKGDMTSYIKSLKL